MWTLAWRNVWRHRNRSLVSAGVVAVVVLITLIFFAFTQAAKTGMFQVLTDEAGHLRIIRAGARDAGDFGATLMRDAAGVEAVVKQELFDALVTQVLEAPALVSGETRSRGVRLVGVGQDDALRQRFEENYLAAGRMPDPGSWDEIALGAALARALRVELGDVVYAFAPGTEGWGASAYTVVGLLSFPQTAMEIQTAYLSLEGAQELAAPGAATRFEIHLSDVQGGAVQEAIEAAKARLVAALDEDLTVETWREAAPDLATILDIMDPMMMVFAFFIFVLAGLFVVNTIYLGLVERIREFGVIIAVGADRRRVMRMVFAESLALVLTGSAAGLAVSGALVAWMSKGVRFPGFEEVLAELGMPTVFYPALTPAQVAITMAFTIATALGAALWPAWVAGRLEPVEAMRHVA